MTSSQLKKKLKKTLYVFYKLELQTCMLNIENIQLRRTFSVVFQNIYLCDYLLEISFLVESYPPIGGKGSMKPAL